MTKKEHFEKKKRFHLRERHFYQKVKAKIPVVDGRLVSFSVNTIVLLTLENLT